MLAQVRRSIERSVAVARDARDSRFRRRLARDLLDSLPERPLSNDERAEALRFLRQFSPRHRNVDWHAILAATRGGFEAACVPDDIFHIAIHPALNPRDRLTAIGDKNGYDRLGLPMRLPETVVRIIRGKLVGADYRALTMDDAVRCAAEGGATEVVLKRALGSRGGKEVRFVTPTELPRVLAPLLERQGIYDDWLVQRPIEQCEELAAFNSSSVNTLRIMTYRSRRGVEHLSTFLRMGRAGSRVDNMTGGGLACGVTAETGALRPYGHLLQTLHEPLAAHPDSALPFEGFRVPAWREALNACIAGHEMIPALDLISWDIAIDDEQRPTFIEFNIVEQDIRVHQVENGPFPRHVVAEWASRAPFWAIGGLVIRKQSPH